MVYALSFRAGVSSHGAEEASKGKGIDITTLFRDLDMVAGEKYASVLMPALYLIDSLRLT